ncbi:zinc-finger domain-containing protein [Rhizobium sp. CRIBSB]|nr:zinc-finger domain-containing protein [Rhizobium sp. CRIBSB]
MPPRHSDTSAPQPEQILVTTTRVACDGGGGALGHPLVYMDMGEDEAVECGYCDRRFVLATSSGVGHAYPDPAARPPEAH